MSYGESWGVTQACAGSVKIHLLSFSHIHLNECLSIKTDKTVFCCITVRA